MRRRSWVYTRTEMNQTMMTAVSAWRALVRTVRRQPPDDGFEGGALPPAVFWGRVGAYDAVCRRGILFLLDPEPAHPSLRVRNGA